MTDFQQLLEYVREHYPPYAYVVKPDVEIAVDGLIFRPKADRGFLFLNEDGEQEVTLEDAIQALGADLAEVDPL